ncbi:hypothetical protein [Psychroserpens sp. SPM9]|uniref:hypothetical protein n=1 Tax=Psychroserpens sp. SPM9 TaxID=2975598 RepID=UPI0021A473D2|nr:hypothetical protein [Psychroserpens sp. SPM9]MDG5491936.1 hypothetical protein [Psychroserpens sp. SPM9]
MKKIITCLFAFVCFHTLNAQDTVQFQVEYGSIFKNDKREIPTDIIAKDDNGYYLLYAEGRFGQGDDISLRQFDLNLTPTCKEIEFD